MSKWKKGLAITAGSFTLIAVGASLAGGNDSTSSTPAKHDRPAATSQATETEAPKSVKKELREEQKQNPEPEEIEVTPEMRGAPAPTCVEDLKSNDRFVIASASLPI